MMNDSFELTSLLMTVPPFTSRASVSPILQPVALQLSSLLEQAADALQRGDTIYALALADQAEILATAQNDFYGVAQTLLIRARALYHRADYSGTLDHLNKAVALLDSPRNGNTQRNTLPLRRQLLQFLGMTQHQLGDDTAALGHFQRALALADVTPNSPSIPAAQALYGIMSVFQALGDHDAALEPGERAALDYHQAGDRVNEAAVRIALAQTYNHLSQFDKALEYAQTGWELIQAVGVSSHAADAPTALLRMAQARRGLKQYDAALDHLIQALDQARMAQSLALQVDILQHQAMIHEDAGRQDDAISVYAAAVEIAVAHQLGSTYYAMFERLSAAHERRGDAKQALTFYRQFHQYKEAQADEAREARLQQTQVRLRTERAQLDALAARREADMYRQLAQQIDQQRQHDQATFEQINHLRDDLLRDTAHDMKSPLTSIRMSLYLLRSHSRASAFDTNAANEARWLNNIDTQVQRLYNLITEVFDLVKLESRQALDLLPHSVMTLIQTCVNEFALQAHEQSITLAISDPDARLIVMCDEARVTQVICNLLSNALKYTPVGGTITISAARQDNLIAVRVRDTGMGIPVEDQPQIFERFYRVQRPQHRAIEGTGLGLAICKTIVEQHGGTIWVESQPDSADPDAQPGSMFAFTLPAP